MAAITALSALAGDILLDAPGCPPGIVLRELKQAVRRFCKESLAWQETLNVISLTDNQPEYTLTHSNTDAQIHSVVWVKVNGTEKSPDEWELTSGMTKLRFRTGYAPTEDTDIDAFSAASTYAVGDNVSYSGKFYTCDVAITVAAAWDVTKWREYDYGLQVRVSFMPNFTAETIPSWFYERFADAFIQGTLAALLRQPGKPWSNPQMARDAETAFQDALSVARSDWATEYSANSQIAVVPRFC